MRNAMSANTYTIVAAILTGAAAVSTIMAIVL
jgi:hypothetical protein